MNLINTFELHLMEGAVNHIYIEIEKHGGTYALGHISNMLQISKRAQNDAFNDNACLTILTNCHVFDHFLPIHLKHFSERFRLLN